MGTFASIITQQESQFNLQNYVKYEPKIATTEPTILPLKEQEGNEFVLVEGIPFSSRRSSIDLSAMRMGDK